MNAERTKFEALLRAVPPSHEVWPAVQTVLQIVGSEANLKSLIIRDKTMPATRTADIYRSRFENLSRKGIACGGFLETVSALTSHADPVRAISCETESNVIVCFADAELRKLVGCVYSERED